jgi:hypothetical protein
MNVERFKEFYENEWQRHEHLQSAVNTPISIVTLLAGGLVLMGKGFEGKDTALIWLFWIATAVASVLVSGSVYFLTRSIHGYRYDRIPLPAELARHYEHLKQFYREQQKPGLTDPSFDAYLVEKYVTTAERNAVNNLKRGEYLDRANRFLVYALCATASAGFPAAIAVKTARPQPQEVRITNLRRDVGEILETWKVEGSRRPPRGAPRGTSTR